MAYVLQRYSLDPPEVLKTPVVFDLLTDPRERETWPVLHAHTWVHEHVRALREAFERSVEREPLIPAGAPLDHVPGGGAAAGADRRIS